MTKMLSRKILSLLLVVLLAVAALTGCTDSPETPDTSVPPTVGSSTLQELGVGETDFILEVTDNNGEITRYHIRTDEETVGAALLSLHLIEGENSEYGLYVKSVNGLTADYDVDQSYWAFYVDGEYAMAGIDATTVEADTVYGLVYTVE